MTTVEAIKLAAKTLDRLAWDCDLTDNNEAKRLWEASELLVDVYEGRRGLSVQWFGESSQSTR